MNLISLNVTSNISNTGNLLVTQNTTTGNLSVTTLANIGTCNATNEGVYANGTVVIAGVANLNFNNTATINVAVTANGAPQSNIALSANGTALGIPAINTALGTMNTATGVAYGQANSQGTYANGTAVVANISNVNWNNTATMNVSVTANGNQSNVAWSANGSAIFANNGIFVAGSIVANSPNINFVASNTSNLSITGTSNTSPGNVTITFDTRVPAGGGSGGSVNVWTNASSIVTSVSNLTFNNTATTNAVVTANGTGANIGFSMNTSVITGAASPNLSIQLNVAGTLTGSANLLMNTAQTNVYIEANVQIANGSNLCFGGGQANIANANMALSWNVTSNSLDFIWV